MRFLICTQSLTTEQQALCWGHAQGTNSEADLIISRDLKKNYLWTTRHDLDSNLRPRVNNRFNLFAKDYPSHIEMKKSTACLPESDPTDSRIDKDILTPVRNKYCRVLLVFSRRTETRAVCFLPDKQAYVDSRLCIVSWPNLVLSGLFKLKTPDSHCG